jgi:hypothetical protein
MDTVGLRVTTKQIRDCSTFDVSNVSNKMRRSCKHVQISGRF